MAESFSEFLIDFIAEFHLLIYSGVDYKKTEQADRPVVIYAIGNIPEACGDIASLIITPWFDSISGLVNYVLENEGVLCKQLEERE